MGGIEPISNHILPHFGEVRVVVVLNRRLCQGTPTLTLIFPETSASPYFHLQVDGSHIRPRTCPDKTGVIKADAAWVAS